MQYPILKQNWRFKTATFRDKLEPGTEETWSFKIKGPKGDKVSAELLASMYDTSLDQFKSHAWNFKPIHKSTFNTYNRTNARQSFGTQNFRVYLDRPRIQYPRNSYDQLNWFGFHFGNNLVRFKSNVMARSISGRTAGVEIEGEAMMVADDANLDEVVVVGYGTQKKESITGTIVTVEESTTPDTEEKPKIDEVKNSKKFPGNGLFLPTFKNR